MGQKRRIFAEGKSPPLLAKREAAKGGESKKKFVLNFFFCSQENIKNLLALAFFGGG